MRVMSTITCYHGTTVRIAKYYLDGNDFVLSMCGSIDADGYRDLWLGDGFYLFDDPFHAFKWITQQCYKKKSGIFDKTILDREYRILKIRLNYPVTRVFDLRQTEHYAVFQRILDRIVSNSIPDTKIPDGKVPDGVVINYIFKKMDYGKRFDIVCGIFKFNESYFSGIQNLKSNFIVQTQYCVKKIDLLDKREEYDYTYDSEGFIDIWKTLFPNTPPIGIEQKNMYSPRKGVYYES